MMLIGLLHDWLTHDCSTQRLKILFLTMTCNLAVQRINHFPGMGEICRKDSLARNLQK